MTYKTVSAGVFPWPGGKLFAQPAAFAHGLAAEFGADLVHRPLGRRPLVAHWIDQARRIGLGGGSEVGETYPQKPEAPSVRFFLQRDLRRAENLVGQLRRRFQ